MPATAKSLYPFVPSGKDFETSLEFFQAIGFAIQWKDSGIAGLRFGGAYFLLQDVDIPIWQENQMITFEVDDLEDYSRMLDSLELEKKFAGVKVKQPIDYPWGREVHFIDPAGVCWHVRQSV
jgi:hypothetical protein